MKQKFVHLNSPKIPVWNQVCFLGCKVLSIQEKQFKAGKRISIEIEAPKFKKKFYLFGFNDGGLVDTIINSGIRQGDIISCYAELSYYQNSDGRHCEAYKLMANQAYESNMPETDKFFQFMRICREDTPVSQQTGNGLSKDQIVAKMLGIA